MLAVEYTVHCSVLHPFKITVHITDKVDIVCQVISRYCDYTLQKFFEFFVSYYLLNKDLSYFFTL